MKNMLLGISLSILSICSFAKATDVQLSKKALEVKSLTTKKNERDFLNTAAKSAKEAAAMASKVTLIASSVGPFIG